MNDRVMFIVFNGEIKFLKNSDMDHREWYQSLGGDMEEYDDVIRGYVMEGKIIYFKANLNYDSEVIDFATKMAIPMKKQLNQPDLKVCCGISPGQDGRKWEPILILKEEDLEGYVAPEKGVPELPEDIILQRKEAEPIPEPIPEMEEQLEIQRQKELEEEQQRLANEPPPEPIVEFKNDLNDPTFIKNATKFTIIMLVIAILSKMILVSNKTISTDNRWIMLLIMVQIGTLVFSIVGYNQKLNKMRYIGLASAAASVLLFDLVDIVIGVLIFLFTIDATYIIKLMEFIKTGSKKAKELVNSKSKKGAAPITPVSNSQDINTLQPPIEPPDINNPKM